VQIGAGLIGITAMHSLRNALTEIYFEEFRLTLNLRHSCAVSLTIKKTNQNYCKLAKTILLKIKIKITSF